MNDGKHLEALVAFVEKTMLPNGYDVKTNQQIYNDEGIQIAEFDVEIRGKLGTTDIAWLIECRDRPSSGPAPGSWIEQLVGRRSRFGFNKITAVSTTGFAKGAQDFAKQEGIELRVVEALTPDAFSSWLQLRHMAFLERRSNLESAKILISKNISEEIRAMLHQIITSADGTSKILRSIKTGEFHTLANAFLYAVEQDELFNGVKVNGEGKKVVLRAEYVNNEDHFEIETKLGQVRVEGIVFCGELTIVEKLVPIDMKTKYQNLETGETISQMASFAPHEIGGMRMSLEFHRIGEDGKTYVSLRRTDSNA